MNFIQIEQHFNDESLILDILEAYTPCFNEINELNRQMRSFEIRTPNQIDEVLTRFTGLSGTLTEVLCQAEFEKNDREVAHLEKLKMENAKRPSKDQETITALKNEASAFVSTYRRVRNIFNGYVNISNTSVTTCQSRLKKVNVEMQHMKQYNARKMGETSS